MDDLRFKGIEGESHRSAALNPPPPAFNSSLYISQQMLRSSLKATSFGLLFTHTHRSHRTKPFPVAWGFRTQSTTDCTVCIFFEWWAGHQVHRLLKPRSFAVLDWSAVAGPGACRGNLRGDWIFLEDDFIYMRQPYNDNYHRKLIGSTVQYRLAGK